MFLPGIIAVIKIASIIVSSWIVIHLLALFGVFVAIAYPFWWFIAPKSTVCLNCQARARGNYCSFCKAEIIKDNHPKNFRSVLLNSSLVLLFSLFSMGVVYSESILFRNLNLARPTKNVAFVVEGDNKYKLYETFPMEIQISGIAYPINAIQVDVSYDPTHLEVVDFSTESSFATVFINKEINNDVGFARLTGGLPNPGYTLDKGLFGTVIFRSKAPGETTVKFLPTSVVLANDSKGTNVLGELPSASYYILEDPIINGSSKESQIHLQSSLNVLGASDQENQVHLYLKNQIQNSTNSKSSFETNSKSADYISFNLIDKLLGFLTSSNTFVLKSPQYKIIQKLL